MCRSSWSLWATTTACDEKGVEYARKKPEIVAKSMEEFSKPQYGVDVLKVEVPVNMALSRARGRAKAKPLTRVKRPRSTSFAPPSAAKKPFIYLSAGVSNEVFNETLELAAEANTNFAGVLCGRATWKEGIPVYAKQGIRRWKIGFPSRAS